jgi:hypothetical protein
MVWTTCLRNAHSVRQVAGIRGEFTHPRMTASAFRGSALRWNCVESAGRITRGLQFTDRRLDLRETRRVAPGPRGELDVDADAVRAHGASGDARGLGTLEGHVNRPSARRASVSALPWSPTRRYPRRWVRRPRRPPASPETPRGRDKERGGWATQAHDAERLAPSPDPTHGFRSSQRGGTAHVALAQLPRGPIATAVETS